MASKPKLTLASKWTDLEIHLEAAEEWVNKPCGKGINCYCYC